MKFIVNSTDLLSRLQIVSRVIAPKSTLPILEDVLFDIVGGKLTLTASDLDTTLVTTMDLPSADADIKVAISSKMLLETVREFSDQPLEFNINDNNFAIIIKTASGSYNLVGQNGAEYPALPSFDDNANNIVFPVETLYEAISKTIFATTDDDLRPVMNGVNFDITTDSVTTVATDAHKLVRFTTSEVKGSADSSFILAKKSANPLLTVLQKESGNVVVKYDSKNLQFSLDNYNMYCRQVEGRFPNYNGVIPQNNPRKVVVDRQAFIGALKRVSIFSNEASNLIKLHILPNEIQVSAQDLDFSVSAEEKLQCQYDGDEMSIGFKSSFLVEILKNIDSDEILMELADASRAGIILPLKNKENEDLLMLLMPMLLNE
ncbi:MAG: DNA polymerase III subunit beta [Paludibacteraceae bacterium]|nr:DNA polymerase III subunit beta [Paludibacteraceae bacterium]MBP5743015.1 DNA polymerase III subunit beta [Paludibacteraceae bacterium]